MSDWLARFRQVHYWRSVEGIAEPFVIFGAGNIIVPGAHSVRVTSPVNDNMRELA